MGPVKLWDSVPTADLRIIEVQKIRCNTSSVLPVKRTSSDKDLCWIGTSSINGLGDRVALDESQTTDSR